MASRSIRASRRADAVLLDTGVLVALHNADDRQHERASRWLASFHGQLHTVEAVLTETAFFLPVHLRPMLASLAAKAVIRVHPLDAAAYERLGELLAKYADQDPDWADVCLIWLAEHTGIRRVATVDVTDFSVYRIHGRSKFLLEALG